MVGPEEEENEEEFLEVVRPAKKRGEPRKRENRLEPKRGRKFEAEQLEVEQEELELLEPEQLDFEQLEPEQHDPRVQDAGEHGQKPPKQICATQPGEIDDFVWEVNMETLEVE